MFRFVFTGILESIKYRIIPRSDTMRRMRCECVSNPRTVGSMWCEGVSIPGTVESMWCEDGVKNVLCSTTNNLTCDNGAEVANESR